MNDHIEIFQDHVTPLDNVERIMTNNNWVFNRTEDDEIVVQLDGRSCTYKLFFIWQENMNAMQFCCQMDLKVPDAQSLTVMKTLTTINQSLWIHTCLFRGTDQNGCLEQIEDLVDISMAQCERYHTIFSMLAGGDTIANDDDIHFALMDHQGEG